MNSPSEKAQDAADLQQLARVDIACMIKFLETKVSAEADDPEGTIVLGFDISNTLAKQWLESLRYTAKRI